MKRRVGKYKDKIIVEGDKNEFKSHEVSINELAGTNSSGGDNSGSTQIEYYKVINNINNNILSAVVALSAVRINVTQTSSAPTTYIGAGAALSLLNDSPYNIVAFGFNDKKTIALLDGGNVEYIFQGTLQERADYIATMEGMDKVNIYDYIEPITEEEFYNLKYE